MPRTRRIHVDRRQPVQKGIRGVTMPLRKAIRAEAVDRGLSMNDVILDILGRRFHMTIDPSPRTSRPPSAVTDSDVLTIRMPIELRNAIRHESVDQGLSDEQLILATISDALAVR